MYAVASHDPLDVFNIARIEELRTINDAHQFGLGAKHSFHALRSLAFPTRANDKKATAIVARGAAADIVEVVGVKIDQLDTEIAVLSHRSHSEHERFGAQVQGQLGVGRIRIRCLHRLVVRRVDTRNVMELVHRPPVLGTFTIEEVIVYDAVAIHHRIAIDIGFFGDGADFIWCESRLRKRERWRNQ